ncbi:MAG: GH116 family glycosyl hydrolase [Opitutales bacterium]
MNEITLQRSALPRSGMALGGIGTGSFEIRPDGGFYGWTIYNNWPLFTGPQLPYRAHYPFDEKQSLFFLLWLKPEHEDARIVLLQIEEAYGAAGIEDHELFYMFPWVKGVDLIRYRASVPFAELDFEQEGLPLEVRLRAWSPFIPGNVKDSALPTAYFDFDIVNTGDRPVDIQILASCKNLAAYNQPERQYHNRRVRDGDFSAILMGAEYTDPKAPDTGELCLASHHPDSTAYMGWAHQHPYYERLLREYPMPEHDDTVGRNSTKDETLGRNKADAACYVTIGRAATLGPRGADDRLSHGFSLSWHFPNLYGRPSRDDPNFSVLHPCGLDTYEGQWYANHFESAEAVGRYAAAERGRLLAASEDFHRVFFDSDLPECVLDQVNSQLNTFRTSSWLTQTGMFGILEGLSPHKPFAGIATTDVAMYGQIASSLLFPELDRTTVDLWRKLQRDNGIVTHSVTCNSENNPDSERNGKRLDMPAQFAFQALRAALWSGDRSYLESVWPDVKKALAYVLRERDMNGDHLPDMEGIMCSYDNFPMFGVAPFVVSQWLAAVAAALNVARHLGDQAFVDEYEPYFEEGRATFEKTTWNGSYFKLYSDHQEDDPHGEHGCMVDQIIGEGCARQLGLPAVIDPEKTATAARTILRLNYRPDQGLRNCQWPTDAFLRDIAPDTWVDQANTCWTGVELNFAAHLYHLGMTAEAEEIIRNVDARYKRQGLYYDHQEFGGHYFRPMSALAIPNAFLGLSYDGETLRIAPARELPYGRWCVLLPGAYGTFHNTADGCRLEIRSGELRASTVILPRTGKVALAGAGDRWTSSEADGTTVFLRE